MSLFVMPEDDGSYYALTTLGSVALVVLIVVLLLLISLLTGKKEKKISVNQLAFSAMALALAFVLSNLRIVKLPWGGSATLCSMLFVTLIGYWYGPRVGIAAGLAYGILQFIQGGGSYILDLLQACLDYFVAFAALGTSGFFNKSKNGLVKGYIFAILLRGAFHSVGGYLYWMDYIPEGFPTALIAVYPIIYNYAYILLEGVITLVIISLPPVSRALVKVKSMATN